MTARVKRSVANCRQQQALSWVNWREAAGECLVNSKRSGGRSGDCRTYAKGTASWKKKKLPKTMRVLSNFGVEIVCLGVSLSSIEAARYECGHRYSVGSLVRLSQVCRPALFVHTTLGDEMGRAANSVTGAPYRWLPSGARLFS